MEVAMSSQVAVPRGHHRGKTAAATAHATTAASLVSIIAEACCGIWHCTLGAKRRQSQEGYRVFTMMRPAHELQGGEFSRKLEAPLRREQHEYHPLAFTIETLAVSTQPQG